MKNNSDWFKSSPNNVNFTHLHLQQEPELEESLINRNLTSLTPFSHHPLSPFMPFSQNNGLENQHLHPIEQESQRQGIHQRLSFSEQESKYEQEPMTPHRNARAKREIQTTSRKSNAGGNKVARKTRPKQSGLRGLSMKAYQVVLQMKETSYKQVAERLVTDLNLKESDNNHFHEETNVKRRVYDALNVLIAARVICRNGRIISNLKGESTNQSSKGKNDEIRMLRKKIDIKQQILQQKQRKLQDARQKVKKTQELLQKNLNNYAQVRKDNTMITFPFIGILYRQEDMNYNSLETVSRSLFHRLFILLGIWTVQNGYDLTLDSFSQPTSIDISRQYIQFNPQGQIYSYAENIIKLSLGQNNYFNQQ